MVMFVVRRSSSMYSSLVYYEKHLKNGDMAEAIYGITNSWEKGIEAESWCELASIGEVYEDDDFTITVVDE